MKTSQDGYSLVEISISLTIIALLLAGGLGIIGKISDAKRFNITRERIAVIEQAIADFEEYNLYLPCPAVGDSVETEDGFGMSVGYADATTGCSLPALTSEAGMVPVRTLNIPDRFAYDGWERKFTYRIASGFGSLNDFANWTYTGNISVSDLAGNEKTTVNRVLPANMGAAYVIISNGPNGNATHSNIAVSTGSNSPGEENRNHAVNRLYIQNDPTFTFSDIVAFKQKGDFVPIQSGISPLNIPGYVCSNARTLATTDALSTLSASNEELATQTALSSEAVRALCNTPPPTCNITPAAISPDDLKLWLDASDPAATDTDNDQPSPASWSSPWKDKSGNGNDASAIASTSPTYATNTLVNYTKPAMHFNGAQSFDVNLNFLVGMPYTIFVVDRRGANTAPAYLLGAAPGFDYGYNSTTFQLAQSAGNALLTPEFMYENEVTALSMGTLEVSSQGQMVQLLFNGTNYLNGYNGDNNSKIGSITATGTIGRGTASGSFYTGDIAEIIIYSVALSANERAAIEGYLYRKWISGECS